MKLPLVAPFEIISQVTPLGSMDLNYVSGSYYVEVGRSMMRAGYNTYGLYFSEWQKPGPLDFGYSPDSYAQLLDPNSPLEFESMYFDRSVCFHLIETAGGLDAYMSRLKSKKRSEFKKLLGNATVVRVIDSPEILNTLMVRALNGYLDSEKEKSVGDWFEHGFMTNKAPINLMLYVGNYVEQCEGIRVNRMHPFLLEVHNADGQYVCQTLCLSDHDGKVLYALSDELKDHDLYRAKDVTIANIEWACANGYHYVDIDNGFENEDTVADPSALVRIAYKKLFYTGTGERVTYFSSEEAYNNFVEEYREIESGEVQEVD